MYLIQTIRIKLLLDAGARPKDCFTAEVTAECTTERAELTALQPV